MATQANNARIWGGDADAIFLAPVGTTLPSTIDAAPGGAFEDVGWIHEDGIVETANGSKEVIRGHQGAGVVRTRMSETGTSIAFTALEDKPQTNSLRYHEKVVTTAGGARKVTRGAGQRVSPRAAVIDFYDIDNETVKKRLCIPRLEIVPTGDKTFSNADISGYGFESEVIGDYDVYESALAGSSAAWDVTVNGTPTGGTYTLAVNGVSTAPLAHNATAAAVATAINALSGVTGIAGVTGSGAIELTFPSPVLLTADGSALSGGTSPSVTVAHS